MDNGGWIKFHRKILDNHIYRYDQTAWRIFEYLLLKADHRTGTVKMAHSTMIAFLKIPKATLSRALVRLKEAEMIDFTRNNLRNSDATATEPHTEPRYTVYSICKWSVYQGQTEQEVEPKRNQNGTKTEHIQEVRIKKEEYNPPNPPRGVASKKRETPGNSENGQKVLDIYNEIFRKKLSSSVGFEENLTFWLTVYSLEDIRKAFIMAKKDPMWVSVMDPVIMLRRRNPNHEQVDYIGQLSSKYKEPAPPPVAFQEPVEEPMSEEDLKKKRERLEEIRRNLAVRK